MHSAKARAEGDVCKEHGFAVVAEFDRRVVQPSGPNPVVELGDNRAAAGLGGQPRRGDNGYQPQVPGAPLNGPTTSAVIQPP